MTATPLNKPTTARRAPAAKPAKLEAESKAQASAEPSAGKPAGKPSPEKKDDRHSRALTQVFLPAAQEFNVRMLAYITFAATFTAGTLTGFHSLYWTAATVGLLVWPLLLQLLTRPARERFPLPTRQLITFFDALIFGACIVVLGLDPLLTLLLLILSCASFIIAGKLAAFSTAILALIAGGAATYHYVPEFVGQTPSEPMLLVGAGLTGLYVLVSSHYMILLARSLRKTQTELHAQSEEYKEISRQLSKYIAPQVWQIIFSGKKDVRLESTRKRLVVFFSDLEGFTRLTDELEPETLTIIVNQYLEEMARIAMDHGGTIDKFIGDSVMVFFGDPDTRGTRKDALACVTMALAMRRKLSELRRRWRKDLGIETELSMRMGINTGFCTVGNFGSESRLDYTIMGREVNLASRLESSAGPNEILISKTTHELVRQVVSSRHKGEVRAKGFASPVPVYEVQGLRRELGEQSLFTDVDLAGFSMQFDTDRLRSYDKERILTALAKAHKHIKDRML
ncbi:MAG: adenylate/guanylate cyclase domain-containing protein [Natronospirillum sp.]|uniref:adenylate/guanylate cyclase domain-containing protein n=1 Tax=Natronospirillum sp. TaxID=2812955 RepID=UPI0025E044A2|nr:adenylate/guanylate cyclase domain-containing protein [Natronospirillum sp.]MCH8553121.1 adenylate/guanylate cyclase domain-containing protein [Natronospirillum sp.]